MGGRDHHLLPFRVLFVKGTDKTEKIAEAVGREGIEWLAKETYIKKKRIYGKIFCTACYSKLLQCN